MNNFRIEKQFAKPFHEIPGPKELPGIGNSWRFAPVIGELIWNAYLFKKKTHI
jgi:hypothetical protein